MPGMRGWSSPTRRPLRPDAAAPHSAGADGDCRRLSERRAVSGGTVPHRLTEHSLKRSTSPADEAQREPKRPVGFQSVPRSPLNLIVAAVVVGWPNDERAGALDTAPAPHRPPTSPSIRERGPSSNHAYVRFRTYGLAPLDGVYRGPYRWDHPGVVPVCVAMDPGLRLAGAALWLSAHDV